MAGRVGLEPVPDDENIANWLTERSLKHEEIVGEVLTGIEGLRAEVKEDGEPDIFAYGKLLNFLASEEVSQPELIAICAGALWWLHDEIAAKDEE